MQLKSDGMKKGTQFEKHTRRDSNANYLFNSIQHTKASKQQMVKQ